MLIIFQEEKWITAGILVFMGMSLFLRIMLGGMYQGMIRETDNMAATNNRLLKQCKLKFANCYQMNNGVANIPIFVDKFINRLSLGPFSFMTIYHLSGQSMLFSIICAGAGICKGIMEGRTLGQVLPFYIVSFFGLYLYFTVSTIVDVKGKRRVLKINLVDYLENHLSSRIGITEGDMNMLYGEEIGKRGGEARLTNMDYRGRGGRTVELMPIPPISPVNPINSLSVSDLAEQDLLPEAEIAEAANKLQPFRISDEELEELLKEFLPT